MRHRERIEPTDDWDQLILLFEWPGQKEYEELRPLVLFGSSVAERSRVTGTPERTLYRKVERFEKDGPRGLFSTEGAKRQVLPPRNLANNSATYERSLGWQKNRLLDAPNRFMCGWERRFDQWFAASSKVFDFSMCKDVLPSLTPSIRCTIIG